MGTTNKQPNQYCKERQPRRSSNQKREATKHDCQQTDHHRDTGKAGDSEQQMERGDAATRKANPNKRSGINKLPVYQLTGGIERDNKQGRRRRNAQREMTTKRTRGVYSTKTNRNKQDEENQDSTERTNGQLKRRQA